MAKRGRKVKLKTREEIEKARGKSTIKFVKTDYRGISKKIKVDENGKETTMGYKANIEGGYIEDMDKNGNKIRKRKKTTKMFKTLTEAVDFKGSQKRISKVDEKKKVEGVTIEQAWNDYFENEYKKRGRNKLADTYLYQKELHKKYTLEYFGKDRLIHTITALEYEAFYRWNNDEGRGFHTNEKNKTTIRGLYKFMRKDPNKYKTSMSAIDDAEISKNRSDKEENFEAKTLTIEQLITLIKYALEDAKDERRDPSYLVLFAFCALSGMRRGELHGMKWGDLEEFAPGGKIRVKRNRTQVGTTIVEKLPNNGKERCAADISEPVYMMLLIAKHGFERILGREMTDDDYIYQNKAKIARDVPDIPNPGKTSRHYQEFCRRCNKKQKQRGLEEIPHHRLHDLRHSYATLLATTKKYNIPQFEISFSMGHSLKGNTTVRVYLQDTEDRSGILEFWNSEIPMEIFDGFEEYEEYKRLK